MTDFNYNKYSLEQLDNWVNDAVNCDDLTAQEIYHTIVNCVNESVEYHKKYYTKSTELLSLLKGHRSFEVDTSLDDIIGSEHHGGWDYDAAGGKFPRTCDRDDPSPECKKDWVDFWEETYYPEEHKQYTEEEMNAMCERVELDAAYEAIREAGGYEWTPLPEKDKVKKWRLPVEEVENGDTMETEYFITFPDDLLEAANLKEGDSVEWIDNNDGSFILKKLD